MKNCKNEKCGKEFESKASNAIYCSDECRKEATNAKVLETYHRKRKEEELRKTKKRVCKVRKCKTILSRYNSEDICELCQTKNLKDKLESWGWNRKKLDEDWSY